MPASIDLDSDSDSFDKYNGEKDLEEYDDSKTKKRLEEEAESSTMILVLGATGAGKSWFINTLTPGSCKT